MDASESSAATTADSAAEPTSESTDVSSAEIAWGPVEYGRLRSAIAGVFAAVLTGVGVVAARAVGGVVDGGSIPSEALIVAAIMLATSWPVVVAFRAAEGDGSAGELGGFGWILPGWSWLRPGWVGVGAASTLGIGWLLGGPSVGLYILPVLFGVGMPVFFGLGRRYRLDPASGTFEGTSTHFDQTWSRDLQWLVGLRRFDLGPMCLFVCSNRGKRWYDGVHVLPVPTELAPEVDAALRGVVDRTGPPERIDRDVRIIVAGVAASMLGVGPLLYLVSGEAAVFLIGGPSGFIAPGLLLHAIRA